MLENKKWEPGVEHNKNSLWRHTCLYYRSYQNCSPNVTSADTPCPCIFKTNVATAANLFAKRWHQGWHFSI